MEAPQITTRQLANAMVVGVLRNGYIEDLHAGEDSKLLDDPKYSRISDAEIKKLMIEVSSKLEWLLTLQKKNPDEFWRQIAVFQRYCRHWDTKTKYSPNLRHPKAATTSGQQSD